MFIRRASALLLSLLLTTLAKGGVLITEIMYHPVEKAAFDANGDPVMDLSGDIHEYIEIHNPGPSPVTLAGWKLSGGIDFTFPPNATITAGQYLVIAKEPARLLAIASYALTPAQVLGPFSGSLQNRGDTVRISDATDTIIDSVSYSRESPWPIGADAFGADDEWTGINSAAHQYRGRSLERVSFAWPASDPANWLASPVAAGPSPARANAVSRAAPLPVVATRSALQNTTNTIIIRAAQQVRVDASFTNAGANVTSVSVEYFVDNINATGEALIPAAMSPAGPPGSFTALLPGQADRSIVRWRIKADRGAGVEVVSPRADDPMQWHTYFVTPSRSSTKPIYDVLIATASLTTLNSNITQSPRRIVNPDPPGTPRASWNATQPAVFVVDGVVYDIRLRHHGSRYNRNSSRNSYKWQFPRYQMFNGREGLFITDKNDLHRLGAMIYDAVDFPSWRCRYIDLYLNSNAVLQRLEQEEHSEELYARWQDEQTAKYPDQPRPGRGQIYKSTGVIPFETGAGQGVATYLNSGEGPYYIGNCAPIPPKTGWTVRQRYEWTYGAQMDSWMGGRDMQKMVTDLWTARGDSPTAPNPSLVNLRAWLAANFDVDKTLTYIALRNWSSPFDNATHNHFLWRQGDGRWAMLPWDLDGEFSNTGQSIYWDEYAVPQPDVLRGPQWVKDSFLKAFRDEYRQKLFILNNTLLTNASLVAIGAGGTVSTFASSRQGNVNTQLGLGTWYAPQTPSPVSPPAGAGVLAGTLQASAYAHTKPSSPPVHTGSEWLLRASGGTYNAPVFRKTGGVNLTSLPMPVGQLVFGQTYFWKVRYFDAESHPSAWSTERSFVFGTSSGNPAGSVRLNEILANGRNASDYIELHNTGGAPVELSGWKLSDDPANPAKHTLPQGATIAAGGFYTLTLDDTAAFELDKDGQTVVLTDSSGALMDSVAFGVQAVDKSIGRSGAGAWELQTPTTGAVNVAEATGSAAGLKVNEWMASSSNGPDWFEIHNPGAQPVALAGIYLSDTVGTPMLSQIAPLSFLAAGGHVRFVADENPGAHHVNFKLSAASDRIILTQSNGTTTIDTVTFANQTTDVSEGRLPDGSATITAFPDSPSPEDPNYLPVLDVRINEVLPDVELHNTTAAPVNIGGWFLSDDPAVPQKHTFTPGTTVPAGGFLTVSAATLPFPLSAVRGGSLILTHGDFRAVRNYGASDPGHPWGVVLTATGSNGARLSTPTFGAANAAPLTGPLVMTEVMYHPPNGLPGPESDYEYIELLNTGASPVSLTGVRLVKEVRYAFPPGETMAPGERVLVAANPAALAAAYTIPGGTRIFGPWDGSLSNAGGDIELMASGTTITTPGPDFNYTPQYLLEEIEYRDTVPWPSSPDGSGHSLRRLNDSTYSNDPANWTGGIVSPGAASAESNLPPAVSIASPANGALLSLGSTVAITAGVSDPDDAVFSVSFYVDGVLLGTDTSAPFAINWTPAADASFVLTARARDGRLASTDSAAVSVTVVNSPPTVTLTSPLNSPHLTWPTAITLNATATDPEGQLALVEFLDNGVVAGTDNTPPFSLTYTPSAPGIHTVTARATDSRGLTAVSAPRYFSVARASTIACAVPAGTGGTQNFGGSLGHDFDVVKPVIVTKLGLFDNNGNGLSTTLTAQLYARNNAGTPNTPNDDTGGALLETLTFTTADPGTLVGGSRFKNLAAPRTLQPGSYTIVSYGANNTDMNGNIGTGNAKVWTTDGAGSLNFVGAARHGTAGLWPGTVDGGPVDRYAAGTFEFITYDADGDGMPLDWEQANGLNPALADGSADPDRDGDTNLSEYYAGTNPQSAASTFRLTSAVVTGPASARITFTARPGRAYILKRSKDFLTWTDIRIEPSQASERVINYDDLQAGPKAFYRLEVTVP